MEKKKTEENVSDRLDDIEKSLNAVLDAVKELTKQTGDLVKENQRWFKAGKM